MSLADLVQYLNRQTPGFNMADFSLNTLTPVERVQFREISLDNKNKIAFLAAQNGNLNVLKQLIDDYEFDIMAARNSPNLTVLHKAIFYGHEAIIEFLSTQYPELIYKFPKLKLPEGPRQNEVLDIFFKYYPDYFHAKDSFGETPLQLQLKKINYF